MRKPRLIFGLLIALTLFGTNAFADTVSFNFASLGTADVLFTGSATPGNGTFTFRPDDVGSYDFSITTGEPSLAGFQGNIIGDFTIGAVSTFLGMSVADVSGVGTFLISDGTNIFTAALEWVDVFQQGTGANLNTSGTVNLSNFAYSGSNAALLSMVQNGNGLITASFTFAPAVDLVTLAETAGTHSTAFSGSVTSTAVPEPNSLLLLGSGLLSLAYGIRRRLQ